MKYAYELSSHDLELLNAHPYIKSATVKRVSFTYECRLQFWEKYGDKPTTADAKEFLSNAGLPMASLPSMVITRLRSTICAHGKPSRGTNKVLYQNTNTFRATPEGNQALLATGKFVPFRNGISFSEEFKQELRSSYPDVSVEDGLRIHGIDPNLVGYQRIYHLQKSFDVGCSTANKADGIRYTPQIVEKYKNHPFVEYISAFQCRFNQDFWVAAEHLRTYTVEEILTICGFSTADFSYTKHMSIYYRLQNMEPNPDADENSEISGSSEFQRDFVSREILVLEDRIRNNLETLRLAIPALPKSEKKKVCQLISELPSEAGHWNLSTILKAVGISRSSYYSILNNENYGHTNEPDPEELRIVREIYERDGFKKGSRQVWMQICETYPEHPMSRSKVLKLMNYMGLQSGIRKPKVNRRENNSLYKKNLKSNLLFRRFRLGKPYSIILTDVTYLDYGPGLRAYKSSVTDAVTGRTLVSVVSANNDSRLVADTIVALKQYTFEPEAIFHSDQGVLYFLPELQNALKEMGFRQSMSRRGICFDNAPQEAYFGHYKDEAEYKNCSTLEELIEYDAKYEYYYNHIRRIYNRNKMTPVEYEGYLLSLNEKEFEEYLAEEQVKYERMRQHSCQAAVQSARRDKQQREEMDYEQKWSQRKKEGY